MGELILVLFYGTNYQHSYVPYVILLHVFRGYATVWLKRKEMRKKWRKNNYTYFVDINLVPSGLSVLFLGSICIFLSFPSIIVPYLLFTICSSSHFRLVFPFTQTMETPKNIYILPRRVMLLHESSHHWCRLWRDKRIKRINDW